MSWTVHWIASVGLLTLGVKWLNIRKVDQHYNLCFLLPKHIQVRRPTPAGCSIYCSRTLGTLFWNDMKWSAHGVLEQCLVYYICVQPCITIFIIVIRIIRRIMICCYNNLFVYISMLLERFYSLILPNPVVQIAYDKYVSKYSV